MMPAIDLTPSQRKTLVALLRRFIPGVEVWAYGSRVKWTARPNSDLDLVAFSLPGQRARIEELKDSLAESDLPFPIDLHVWDEVPERFREIIRKVYVVVQEAERESISANGKEGWRETTLRECAAWLSGGTPSKQNASFWTGPIPWVSAKDMKVFRLHDAEDHISPAAIGNGGKVVPAGTILILVRGMTLHNDVPVCMLMREMAFNQDIKALRPAAGVDGAFLAYWLLAHKPDLLASVDSAGHGTGRLVTDTLTSRKVWLPPPEEQRAIAAVLGALDDKIEVNRRMNATLEAMARALFQSWFVDFDPVHAKRAGRKPEGLDAATAALFPSAFEASPLGQIPKGWEVGRLDDVASIVMGLSPDGDSYNATGIGEPLINGPVEFGDYFPVQTKWSEAATRFAAKDDLVFCVRGSTTGRRVISDGKYGIGRGVCAMRAKEGRHSFLYQVINFGLSRLLEKTTGSVFPSLSAPDIKGFPVLRPTDSVVNAYERMTRPLILRIQENHHQSRTLAALRDTLLPKLLSGEVRVPVSVDDLVPA